MKIAINTGGGDAPGLNAVIRAATLSACGLGWQVVGIRRGFEGLLQDDPNGLVDLTPDSVRGITHLGGTMLGTTNRGSPLAYPVRQPDGSIIEVDRTDEIVARLHDHGVDALIAIGGDGSLRIAKSLSDKGLKVIGVPKTIDNDLGSTAVTFGFQTAVQIATDGIGRLHSTAESHRRIMVVEVMGRDAGWIALFAGLAGVADVILIPEIPYDIDRICAHLLKRYDGDIGFGIVVAAEGAKPLGGEVTLKEVAGAGRSARLGGVAEKLAAEIAEKTGKETRSLVLGHLQRGGEPTAYDKVLALRFGAAAIHLAEQGQFGCMVSLDPPDIRAVPLDEAVRQLKLVPTDGDIVETARRIGVSFGD